MTTKSKPTKIALQPRCILMVLLVCLLILVLLLCRNFGSRFLIVDGRISPLFVYDLDLFVDHLSGKPIDRDVDPIMLFSFYDEIVLGALCIRLVVTRLGDHVDQYVPDTRLRDGSHRARNNLPSCFDSLI